MAGAVALPEKIKRLVHALDRINAKSADRRLELYVKPDDYFEVNEISDRCLDVVGEFRAIVDSLDRA